jgi:hypothetical protein
MVAIAVEEFMVAGVDLVVAVAALVAVAPRGDGEHEYESINKTSLVS